MGNYFTFDDQDPIFRNALENCSGEEPENDEYLFYGQVSTGLGESLTHPNFHMVMGQGNRTPDYYFTGSYEIDLYENIGGKLIQSKLTMNMYFAGTGELVKSWTTTYKKNSTLAHLDKMFNSRSSLMRQERPITKLILEFERPPEKCEINPEKEEVNTLERINIDLSQFLDYKGRQSKEFNRIMVQALWGKILNGTPCYADKDLKIFEIGDGFIEVEYEAPENCDESEDIIRVYHACEIVGALAESNVNKVIKEKKIKINCIKGSIEYNHKIDFDYGAFSQTVTITGSVPFKLDVSPEGAQDEQKVKGKGTVNLSLIWTAEDCIGRSDSPGEIEFEGEIINENEEKYIDIKFDEKWYQNAELTVTCPEVTKSVPMKIPPPVKYENMKFKFKDGEKITRPFAGMGGNGTYSWTLKLPDSSK
jgi:hypothetical protein